MTKKRKKKSQKKCRSGKVFLLLVIVGIGLAILYLFRQEIINSIKPWFETREITKETREIPKEKRGIVLYFSDSEGEYLIGEKREILKKGGVAEEAGETVNELIKGPKGDLIPTLPSRTKLLTLQISKAGLAKVNFDSALSKDHPGGSTAEMMTLYSIVNSLSLNFSEIKKVQILIDGKPVETIAGHLSLKEPVSPKPDLIKRQ